ncbi:hypothetical protein ECZU45_20320 [Escherichia coli]|nr:hypothetical protein ECZU45_20320 [Escherichia coli]
MSYPLFDKDEHWHKPEQAFLTDDHRTILRFAVEALMSGKGAVLVTLVEIRGGGRARSGRRWWCAKMVVTAVLSLAAAWRPLPLLKRWR